MMYTRRRVLQSGALAAAAVTLAPSRSLFAAGSGDRTPVCSIQDTQVKELALRALDTARTAGATYGDVRLTHTFNRRIDNVPVPDVVDNEIITIGVRVLVNGYWGFASSPIWSPNEATRLAQVATAQAQSNVLSRSRPVSFAPIPVVLDGHWETPIRIDPFSIYPIEILDYLASLSLFVRRTPNAYVSLNSATFVVQNKAFASTDGSYCTQRLYRSSGALSISQGIPGVVPPVQREVETLSPAGVGYELYREQPIRDQIRAVLERLKEDLSLPVNPLDVNQYEGVLDAVSISRLLNGSVGAATELDRALGYEANAGGTSYLNRPDEMMATYKVGGSLLDVTSNRSEPGGAATVRWDDEGVVPQDFSVVKDGILQEFQTTRESAGWLAGKGRTAPPQSRGCASAAEAGFAPLTQTTNLTMRPASDTSTIESMTADTKAGILFESMMPLLDFQQLNGLALGRTYLLRNGKRVARIASAGILFRSPELWRDVTQLGGASSARRFGQTVWKGEPRQVSYHSVTAVPARIKNLTVVDPRRKA